MQPYHINPWDIKLALAEDGYDSSKLSIEDASFYLSNESNEVEKSETQREIPVLNLEENNILIRCVEGDESIFVTLHLSEWLSKRIESEMTFSLIGLKLNTSAGINRKLEMMGSIQLVIELASCGKTFAIGKGKGKLVRNSTSGPKKMERGAGGISRIFNNFFHRWKLLLSS